MLQVERELDLVVLYAAGDATGPSAGDVKIGLSVRRAVPEELKSMRSYRSSEIVVHFAHVITGRGRGLRLKTALEYELGCRGRHLRNSWWNAGGIVSDLVIQLAGDERIDLMTADEARALELEKLHKKMDDML